MKKPDLLPLVADEYARAIGRDADQLNDQRQKALEYAKGEMRDVVALTGRSAAVSTDVADAIETVLPDLIEIFTGGDDIATFAPVGPEDEDAAQQETDYVNHVFFNENPGFLTLYTAIKDALLVKTGVFKWWGEEEAEEDEKFEGKTLMEYASAVMKYGDRVEVTSEPKDDDEAGEGPVDFVIRGQKTWRAKVAAVAPEDFGVSKDTIRLSESPYCFHRTRIRAFDLVKRGVDEKIVETLPSYGVVDNQIQTARSRIDADTQDKGGLGMHRLVEIVEHYIDGPDGRWRVMTCGEAKTELEAEECRHVPFAALTPYLVPHQFYGESVADKLIEVQKIRTVLTRMLLDNGYFALNQRYSVDMTKAAAETVTDLINNAPNVPVRTNGSDVIKPITGGGLNFDAAGALEYFAVQAEGRTGIVRNAQGLNPDTLHDTAKGAQALMTAAMKRVRLIARILAETGIKDLFLGLHTLLRENSTGAAKARLRNKWVDVDPTCWGSRSDMTIEIGVGSAGKEAQQMMLQQGLTVLQEVVQMQGGLNGPFITPDNAYAFLKRYFEKGLDFKSADPFLTDPQDAPPQEPQPDPAMAEAQAKLALEQQKAEAQQGLAEQKAVADVQLQQAKSQAEVEMRRLELEHQTQLKREQMAYEMELKREQLQAELGLKREQIAAEIELKRQSAMMGHAVSVATSEVSPGGEPG